MERTHGVWYGQIGCRAKYVLKGFGFIHFFALFHQWTDMLKNPHNLFICAMLTVQVLCKSVLLGRLNLVEHLEEVGLHTKKCQGDSPYF